MADQVRPIARGIDYIDMTRNVGGVDTRMHIVRIQTAVTPCVIGSQLNPPSPRPDPNAPIYHRRLNANLRSSIQGVMVLPHLRSNSYAIQYQGKLTRLQPIWISNGILFGDAGNPSSRIYGPVVQKGVAEVDVTAGLVGGVKGEGVIRRAYTHHKRTLPRELVNFTQNSQSNPPLSASAMASRDTEVIGGGGMLIEEESAHGTAFWNSVTGEKFDSGVWGTCGPVIARSSDLPFPVYYMILCENRRVTWQGMTPYLMNSFPGDVDAARGKRSASRRIHNAVVYDGGDSRQVWIARQSPEVRYLAQPRRNPDKNKVPHYICVWALI